MRNRKEGLAREAATCILATLLLGSAACGNVTVGGLTAKVTIDVSGDAADPLPAPSMSMGTTGPLPASASAASIDDPDEEEGTVEADFLLYLVSESGTEHQLGADDIRVRIDLQGQTEMKPVDRQLVPALRYTELRIVFTHIKAEVEAGLVVGGVAVVGEVRVELEGQALAVSRAIALDVSDGGTADFLIDLNAQRWLDAIDPVTQTVDRTVFASLIDLVRR